MSTVSKSRSDKENAPPRRSAKVATPQDINMDENDDGFGGFSGEDEPTSSTLTKSRKQPAKASKKATASSSKHVAKKPSASEISRKSKHVEEEDDDDDNIEGDVTGEYFDALSDGEKVKQRGGRQAGGSKIAASRAQSGRHGATKEEEDVSEQDQDAGAPDSDTKRRMTDMSNEIAKLKAQLESRNKERDGVSKQLDSLLLKKGEPDKAYEKMKDAAGAQAKAQDKVIQSLETVNDKLTARNATLETEISSLRHRMASGSTDSAGTGAEAVSKSDVSSAGQSEDMKALKEKNRSLKEDLKKRENELALVKKEHSAEIKIASDALRIAEKKAASGTGQTGQGKDVDDQAANDAIIKLYEDLTGLQITRVKLAPNSSEFKCLHSSNERSLEFSLHSTAPFIRNPSRPGGGDYGPKQLEYRPLSVEKEVDRRFVERLGMFAQGFVIPRDQAYSFFQQLDTKVSGNEEED